MQHESQRRASATGKYAHRWGIRPKGILCDLMGKGWGCLFGFFKIWPITWVGTCGQILNCCQCLSLPAEGKFRHRCAHRFLFRSNCFAEHLLWGVMWGGQLSYLFKAPQYLVCFPRSAVVELCGTPQPFSPFQRIPDLLGFKFLWFLKNYYFKSA